MNTFVPIQVIFLIFLIFAASRVFLRAKEGNLSFGSFLFWTAVWILATFSVIKPEFTSYLAKQIGIGRGTDVVIYASIILLFYLIFRTNIMIEDLKTEITKLTTQIAIKEITEKKKRK